VPAAAEAAVIATGRAVFQRVCAPCHGKGPGLDGSPMLPGAAALAVKHQGAVSPYLEERSDLTAEVIQMFVRNGSGTMPMFRKTEISDAEIAAVAAYCAASAAPAPQPRTVKPPSTISVAPVMKEAASLARK
jgi:mono/diheme cytochrome c family protein